MVGLPIGTGPRVVSVCMKYIWNTYKLTKWRKVRKQNPNHTTSRVKLIGSKQFHLAIGHNMEEM